MPGKRPGLIVTALAAAAILAATLPPAFEPPPDPLRPCLFLCGDQGFADFLVNIVLYAPLGVGLALLGWRPRTVALSAFFLAAGIETLQVVLPGRDSSAGDVVANALGGILGLWLTRSSRHWLRPSGKAAAWLPLGWAGFVAAVVGLTAWLAAPNFPAGRWYGQWTPEFGHLEHYDGSVVSARVGQLDVPSWQHPQSDALRTLLSAGAPLEIVAVAGSAPTALAPIFSIADHRHRTMLMVGAEGTDLRLSFRRQANALLLDAPDFRLVGWLGGTAPGDTITIRTWRTPEGICITTNAYRECALGVSPARGWAMLYWLDWAPDWLARVLDVVWIGVLFAPLGLWVRRSPGWMLSMAVGLAALIAVPALTGLRPSGFIEFIGLAAGFEAGLLMRRGARWAVRVA